MDNEETWATIDGTAHLIFRVSSTGPWASRCLRVHAEIKDPPQRRKRCPPGLGCADCVEIITWGLTPCPSCGHLHFQRHPCPQMRGVATTDNGETT